MKTQQHSLEEKIFGATINIYLLNFILAAGTLVGTVAALVIISKCF